MQSYNPLHMFFRVILAALNVSKHIVTFKGVTAQQKNVKEMIQVNKQMFHDAGYVVDCACLNYCQRVLVLIVQLMGTATNGRVCLPPRLGGSLVTTFLCSVGQVCSLLEHESSVFDRLRRPRPRSRSLYIEFFRGMPRVFSGFAAITEVLKKNCKVDGNAHICRNVLELFSQVREVLPYSTLLYFIYLRLSMFKSFPLCCHDVNQ